MNFVQDHFKEFVLVIDSFFKLEGRLAAIFDPKIVYPNAGKDEVFQFD